MSFIRQFFLQSYSNAPFLDEVELIISFVSEKYRPLTKVLAYTGIDVGECVSLKWADIKDGFLVLPRSKTSIGRRIHLNPTVEEVLTEASRLRILRESRVFPNHKISGLDSAWERAKKKAGLDWVRLKDLRHFFASHLINAGVDSLIVARLLGHTDTKMILKRYGHLADDTIQKAVENFA